MRWLLRGSPLPMAGGQGCGAYALVAVRMKPFIGSASAQRKVSGVSGVFYQAGGVWVAVAR